MTRAAAAGHLALLLLANIAGASSVIMIKLSTMHPILLASYRLLLAGLVLLPIFLLRLKRHRTGLRLSSSILPGILLGLHLSTWNLGARMTLAANATLIVNLVPIAMPLLIFLLSRKVLQGRESAGTLVALGGVLVLTVADLHFSADTLPGDIVCLASMILLAAYIALGTRRSHDLILYITPLYLIGGVFTFLLATVFQSPLTADYSGFEVLMVLLLALIPTIIGHSLYNYEIRYLASQLISISMLSQSVFAAVFAYVFFTEIPSPLFYPAMLLIGLGTVMCVRVPRRPVKK